jgi:hypothetical protein
MKRNGPPFGSGLSAERRIGRLENSLISDLTLAAQAHHRHWKRRRNRKPRRYKS